MRVQRVFTLAIISLLVSELHIQTVQSIPTSLSYAASPKPSVIVKPQKPVVNIPTLKFNKTIVAGVDTGYSGSGQPRGTSGGDEQCLPKDPPLTALSPMNPETKTTFVVTTSKATPTLWFYMPDYSVGTTIEFVLKEYQSTNQPYRQIYSLPGSKGIISITVPASQKLTPEKSYVWQLRVICNRRDQSATPIVGGSVKLLRSAAGLRLPGDPAQRIFAYANAGLWDDTLTSITKLPLGQQQQFLEELFQAYGLESFARQKIVPLKKL